MQRRSEKREKERERGKGKEKDDKRAEINGDIYVETQAQARAETRKKRLKLYDFEVQGRDQRVYLADRADVMPVCEILGQTFSDPRPTNTTILCGFPVEDIKVEIEVTARKRG